MIKNNKKIELILVILFIQFFSVLNNYSQDIDNELIKVKLVEHLIEVKQLKDGNAKSLINNIYLLKIIDRTLFNKKGNEIYIFGVNSTHRPTYFLLKNENKLKILNAFNELKTYEEVVCFLKNQNFKKDKNLEYLKRVLNILESNYLNAIYLDDSLLKTNWFSW
ncbi:MAG: hypothetical protein L3J08_09245 [Flavobacteriaceae bacterium]|nr:hypothetical protein [Flavobacteriaceae bacterium]